MRWGGGFLFRMLVADAQIWHSLGPQDGLIMWRLAAFMCLLRMILMICIFS